MSERYTRELFPNDSRAGIAHFKPEENGRDRFGNRLIPSGLFSKDGKGLAYLDGAGINIKAGILISPDGEDFIKENPGILKWIDQGLAIFEKGNKLNTTQTKIILEDDDKNPVGALEYIKSGGQSNFYILVVGGKKYAIKTHRDRKFGEAKESISQPYINEMLQTQSVAHDLERRLADLNVKMANFIFASGQVSCTSYEENASNYLKLTFEIIRQLQFYLNIYLSMKRDSSNNPLWENVRVDLEVYNDYHEMTVNLCRKNFISRADGELVWIDPFIHFRSMF